MAYQIPTTQFLVNQNISFFESQLNQNVPSVDKAYIRVKAIVLATIQTSIFKLSIERGLQCLAITATGQNLTDIGLNYGVIRKPSEAAQLRGTIPTTASVTLPQTYSFIGDNNSIRYFPDSSYASVANVITADVTSEELGVSGNLIVGDTMEMATALPGSSTTLTITEVLNIGAEEESDEVFRQRVLEQIRTVKGGGNSADYRKWSNAVAGVAQSFPYSVLPYPQDPILSEPPDRTIYVQADESIDPDGIPPSSLLDEVRLAINTNQDTGIDNEPLGVIDQYLYVEPIRITVLYYEVRGLDVPASDLASITSQIETAFEVYSKLVKPYIDGLDFIGDKIDTITDLVISGIVENIISSVGGDAEGVTFGLTPGINIPRYTLSPGEKTKSGGVTFI